MIFTIHNNLVFIISMQFINSSLHSLVKICQKWILNIYRKNLVMIC